MRRLAGGISPVHILLLVAFLEVAINRVAVPLLRPSKGTPPTWHTALDYAGLFLFYFAGTLAAYKFFEIKVGQKFRTFVIAAMFGMAALSLMEIVLSLFGAGIGLYDNGALGLLFAVAGLVLGVFMLILDFDFIEQGIRNGIPARESWRASFALTVSLVWIYTNLLRILAILQND